MPPASDSIALWQKLRKAIVDLEPNQLQDGLMDLTPYLTRKDYIGGGTHTDIFKGELSNLPPQITQCITPLPTMAIKVIRAVSNDNHALDGFGPGSTKRRERFQKELQVWLATEHQNILPFVGIATIDHNMSLVTVWMRNGNVMSYLTQHPGCSRFRIVSGITKGLAYLHSLERKIVHGNLTPTDIFMDDKDEPRIGNFSVSRFKDGTLWMSTKAPVALVRWQAPELMAGEVESLETDVYAYSMTCYQIMSDKPPFFTYDNSTAVINAVLREKQRPSPYDSSGSHLHSQLWSLWNSCWSEYPSGRPTMASIESSMSVLSDESGSSIATETPKPSYRKGTAAGRLVNDCELAPIDNNHPEKFSLADKQMQHLPPPSVPKFDVVFQKILAGRPDLDLSGKVTKDGVFPISTGGGFSDIWCGDYEGKKVAIKILREKLPVDAKASKRCIRELEVWSALSHPNVIPLLGFVTEFSLHACFISPWQDNGTAAEFVRALSPAICQESVYSIICGTAGGLAYLHLRGVVHGDLRGDNILISKDKTAVLTDFGKSKMEGGLSVAASSRSGAVRWMAPEVVLHDVPSDAASDVWSFGMTVLELAGQKNPYYESKNDGAVMYKLTNGDKPSCPETVSLHLWEKVCSPCIVFHKTSRPQIATSGSTQY